LADTPHDVFVDFRHPRLLAFLAETRFHAAS
jgi:hypothetical protein